MSFSHWCHSKAFTFPSCWAEVCKKKHGQKQHFNAQNLWKLEYWHILQINPSFDLPKIIRIIQEYTRKSSEDRYSTNMNKQYQTIWNKIKCNKRSYSTCKNPQMEIPLSPPNSELMTPILCAAAPRPDPDTTPGDSSESYSLLQAAVWGVRWTYGRFTSNPYGMKWKSLGIVLMIFLWKDQNVWAKCGIWVRLNIGDASRRPLDSGFFSLKLSEKTDCGWNERGWYTGLNPQKNVKRGKWC
jgi:hypothetical protein